MDGICSYCGQHARLVKGLCIGHWAQQNRGEELHPLRIRAPKGHRTPCSFEGCPNRRGSKFGLCQSHTRQLRTTGKLTDLGEGRPFYATGEGPGLITPNGYRIMFRPNHPSAQPTGKIFEHRMVMSDHLGRALLPEENVHHRNGDRLDNRIANLELWTISQPKGGRVVDKVAWAIEFLSQYGYEVTPIREVAI